MRTVLLIGADLRTTSFYALYFEAAGLPLLGAELDDGIASEVRVAQPEAVILDLSCSGADGAQLLRRLRAECGLANLPVLIVGNRHHAGKAEQLLRAGAAKVMDKNDTSPQDLIRAVREVLDRSGNAATNAPWAQAQPKQPEPSVRHPHLQNAPAVINQLSTSVRLFCGAAGAEKRMDLLVRMQQEIHALSNIFLAAKFVVLADFSSSLSKLLAVLSKDLNRANPSILRTISFALDALSQGLGASSQHQEIERLPIRILAVDDEEVCRRTLFLALSQAKFEVTVCDGAEQALNSLRTGSFDVVFTDIMMPRMDGHNFTLALRKFPHQSNTPVVFVTALSNFETRSKSILSGGCDFIAKPFTAIELVVKAYTLTVRRRLAPSGPNPASTSPI